MRRTEELLGPISKYHCQDHDTCEEKRRDLEYAHKPAKKYGKQPEKQRTTIRHFYYWRPVRERGNFPNAHIEALER
jgi:hypothetical protein